MPSLFYNTLRFIWATLVFSFYVLIFIFQMIFKGLVEIARIIKPDKTVKIFNHNVLGKNFASTGYFNCDEKYLNFGHRIRLIHENIERAVKNKQIITLQEADEETYTHISGLFKDYDYHVIWKNFLVKTSTIGNQQQAVLVAFPKSDFELLDSISVNISDGIEIPIINSCDLNLPPPEHVTKAKGRSVYEMATRDSNILVGMLLRHNASGETVWVFCYHIPCIWWWPAVMTLQIDALKKKMYEVAKGVPFILCSDTNCKKGYHDRTFLETGVVDPSILPHKGWTPSPDATYKLKDTMTPEGSPTTRCKPVASSDLENGEFHANLDGIFAFGFDKKVKIETKVPEGTLNSPCPNETQPSDHAPLHGTIWF